MTACRNEKRPAPSAPAFYERRPLKAQFGNVVQTVVERTFGWMMRWRRLVRDYEQHLDVSKAMIHIALGSLFVRHIAH
jgi:hypothetical protein